MKNFVFNTIGRLDLIAWLLVLMFFCGSAILFGGSMVKAAAGAAGIIVEMFFIAIAIEVIIECLKNKKGIGTLTGFITNGPEAVVLIVGLVVNDIIFAASTPLGSNFMNPVLLFSAAVICGQLSRTVQTNSSYFISTIAVTAGLAGSFFLLDKDGYPIWLLPAIICTAVLFYKRPDELHEHLYEQHSFNPNHWLVPAILVLTVSGYFLDPVVTFTASHSHAPKGVIGFFVLATLTSWPEFKSCISLISRGKHLAAVLNIAVSNITNIWLASAGVLTYLFLQ